MSRLRKKMNRVERFIRRKRQKPPRDQQPPYGPLGRRRLGNGK